MCRVSVTVAALLALRRFGDFLWPRVNRYFLRAIGVGNFPPQRDRQDAIDKARIINFHVLSKTEHFGKAALCNALMKVIGAFFGFVCLNFQNAFFGLNGDVVGRKPGQCHFYAVMLFVVLGNVIRRIV